LLICQPRGVGRELLHALAQAGCGWLGFRVQTPRDLAKELAAPSLAEAELTPIDGFEELALLDEAIDAVRRKPAGEAVAHLGDLLGFRTALAESIRELRLAGLDASDVARIALAEPGKGDALAAIQNHYETALEQQSLVDLTGVLRHAVEGLGEGHAALAAQRVYLVPGMPSGGLRGALLEGLLRGGAEVLPGDSVVGLDAPRTTILSAFDPSPTSDFSYLYAVEDAPAPTPAEDPSTPCDDHIQLFAAASPADEIREVLRRVMAAGIPWDSVEIVATDRIAYGTALDSIAPHLTRGDQPGSRVTHAAGLPCSRTRVGRAVAGYLHWIQEDFPDHVLRALLQDGLLRVEHDGNPVSGPRAARVLHGLRIGWGRRRYRDSIDWALERLDRPDSGREDRQHSDEHDETIRERRFAELKALESMLSSILDATPPTPDRLGTDPVPASPAALAAGLLAFLEFVPTPEEPDTEAEAKRSMVEVLDRTAATLTRRTRFGSAVAILERFIDLRVPSPSTYGRVPWSSAGGHIHFSDIDHGGLSGRRHTFMVGLDAGRFPGTGRQDALLLDSDRGRLTDHLPISADVLAERRHAIAALLARLRGTVTLSYSAWEAGDGRILSPSPLLLQAFRLKHRNPAANYEDLKTATRPIVGPIPSPGGLIDGNDIWLQSLDQGGVLRRGTDVVRQAFENLDAGLNAQELRANDTLNAHNGLVDARPQFDPRRTPDVRLSASRLETLAACPLQYFYDYVLGFEEPADVRFEPDQWLDARQRGSIFHDVYERLLAAAKQGAIDPADAAFVELAESILTTAIRRTARQVPVPSRALQEREVVALRADLDVFIDMVRADKPRWLGTEWKFGFDDDVRPPAQLQLRDATVLLRGAVDRIDELDSGGLRIVDYKTGGTYAFGEASGIYDGGRRLQHALYTHAVEQHLERNVDNTEYHLPTLKGEGSRFPYSRDQLDKWPQVLDDLFDMIGSGFFPAPPDQEPPCTFCEFRRVCRVRGEFRNTVSPPVEWSIEQAPMLPQYDPLRRVRTIDE
jgi:ATP-dependent helicase/nuclease subunit B